MYIKLQKNSKKPAGRTWTKCGKDYKGNRGFLCGIEHTVVDVDLFKDDIPHQQTLNWLATTWPLLDTTKCILTTSNNYHFYFKKVDLPSKNLRKYGIQVEIKNRGTYVVAEGSIVNDIEYTGFNDNSIKKMSDKLLQIFRDIISSNVKEKKSDKKSCGCRGIEKIYKMFETMGRPTQNSEVTRVLLKRDICPNGIQHNSNNTYAVYSHKKDEWYMRCFDEECNHIKVPILIHPEHKEFNDDYWSRLPCYNSKKSYFEQFHMKLLENQAYVRLFCNYKNLNDFHILSEQQIKTTYRHLTYWIEKDDKKKKHRFIDEWFDDINIKKKHGITFAPLKECPRYFNLFRQFAYKKAIATEDINYLDDIKHLVMCLAGGDEIGYEKIMIFIADILFNPCKKRFGKCLIFTGDQGTGKTAFWNWIGTKIIGSDYYKNTANIKDITGQFASALKNNLLVVLEEMSGKDGFENAEKLKDIITNETIRFEEKYRMPYQIDNFSRPVYITNNETPAKIERGCRRYEPFITSSEHKGDDQYWTHIHEVVFKCPNTIIAFVDYLSSLPWKTYVWKEHDNLVKQEMKISSVTPVQRFLIELCRPKDDNDISHIDYSDNEKDDDDIKIYSIRQLHRRYRAHIENEGGALKTTIKLGKELRTVAKDFIGLEVTKTSNRNYKYHIHKSKLFSALSTF